MTITDYNKKTGLFLCLNFLIGLLFLTNPEQAESSKRENLNLPAPDFTLKSNNGENIRLEELAGKVILINFWASWCSPCREELPELETLYQKYKSRGFVILAISGDSKREKAEEFIRPLNLSYPILYDDNLDINSLYRVKAMPSTYLVDRTGIIRYQHLGFKKSFINLYEAEIKELLDK